MKLVIRPYEAIDSDAFRQLNEAWIKQYFLLEPKDLEVLLKPQENILDKGGHILVAHLDETPVGVCALIKMQDAPFDYELAKMAVSPTVQGHGIGLKLATAILELAKTYGAKTVYLESNSILENALRLYKKLGFKDTEAYPSPYSRCNIQMVYEF